MSNNEMQLVQELEDILAHPAYHLFGEQLAKVRHQVDLTAERAILAEPSRHVTINQDRQKLLDRLNEIKKRFEDELESDEGQEILEKEKRFLKETSSLDVHHVSSLRKLFDVMVIFTNDREDIGGFCFFEAGAYTLFVLNSVGLLVDMNAMLRAHLDSSLIDQFSRFAQTPFFLPVIERLARRKPFISKLIEHLLDPTDSVRDLALDVFAHMRDSCPLTVPSQLVTEYRLHETLLTFISQYYLHPTGRALTETFEYKHSLYSTLCLLGYMLKAEPAILAQLLSLGLVEKLQWIIEHKGLYSEWCLYGLKHLLQDEDMPSQVAECLVQAMTDTGHIYPATVDFARYRPYCGAPVNFLLESVRVSKRCKKAAQPED